MKMSKELKKKFLNYRDRGFAIKKAESQLENLKAAHARETRRDFGVAEGDTINLGSTAEFIITIVEGLEK